MTGEAVSSCPRARWSLWPSGFHNCSLLRNCVVRWDWPPARSPKRASTCTSRPSGSRRSTTRCLAVDGGAPLTDPAAMRILYPVTWGRPGRHASQAQTVATAAALARAGHEVTLLLPHGSGDPSLSAQDLRARYAVDGPFALIQRPSAWQGDAVLKTAMWLRQVWRDPAMRGADVL